MVVKKSDVTLLEDRNPRGGKGVLYGLPYLGDEILTNKVRCLNVNTLTPGSEIGVHAHESDEEVYFIISGEGIAFDNGTEQSVKSGDLIYTKDRESHGLKNTGSVDLQFLAFIVDL